jgi:hypothetical protein
MTPAPPARSGPARAAAPASSGSHRVTGIVVGTLLALLALGIAFGIYVEFFNLRDPAGPVVKNCIASGASCDQGFLNTMCYIGYALCLFGWALPVGFMVVRLIQRRRAWFWPLISNGVVVVGFYILLAILGRGYGV